MMKKPCRECPFRRDSASGWIGSHEHVQEIIDTVRADQRFPCHMQVNELMEDGEDFNAATMIASVCVGSAQFLSNQLKMSRHPDVVAVQRQVGKNPDVFTMPTEMVAHHHPIKLRRKG